MGCCGRPSSFPSVGQQVVEVVLRMGADTLEDVAQVFRGIHTETLARCGDACQDGGGMSALIAAIKIPILSSYRNPAQTSLGTWDVCKSPHKLIWDRVSHVSCKR
jgi:hypothetical protein